ncbi:MAG: RagB/SusD family nutrient uptake outer membrane protein [Paludibacter sp.]
MKKILILLMLSCFSGGFYSCQDIFLQQPDVSGSTNLETVYSSSVNSFQALMQCYVSTLGAGIGWYQVPYFFLGSLTDELGRGISYGGSYKFPDLGFDPNGNSDDYYANNFVYIRANWLVAENIDKVPDMSNDDKATIKAEIAGLNAYRYMGMFYRYGGVPIVTKSFLPSDNLVVPRASLDETLQYTLQLCDQAIAGLPDTWSGSMTGRLTKGAVMAMKARILMYAARPLFNSATPYLDNGSNNKLICFGNVNPARWDAAIDANLAVFNWAIQQGIDIINTGGSGNGTPNKNAFADYGTATSTPGNSELILAYQWEYAPSVGWGTGTDFIFNFSSYSQDNRFWRLQKGMPTNFLINYYNADGTDPSDSWPKVGDSAPRPATDYITRTKNLEARFHASILGPGFDPAYLNPNPGDNHWNVNGFGTNNLLNYGATFPNGVYGQGCGTSIKFYYHAFNRLWFNMPLFRMAEIYLNLAEAYNESSNRDVTTALECLNIVHNRAGLPSVTETDQTKLRAIIQREWAVEFFLELQRLYQVKHWKLPDLETKIFGGKVEEFQFSVTDASNKTLASSLINYWNAVTYSKLWSPKMFLSPIPQTEINKQVAVQNPGY